MPSAKKSVEQSSSAQGRFTMSLSDDVGKMLDAIGERMERAVAEQLGASPQLSRPQVVTALAVASEREYKRRQDAIAAAERAADNGTGTESVTDDAKAPA